MRPWAWNGDIGPEALRAALRGLAQASQEPDAAEQVVITDPNTGKPVPLPDYLADIIAGIPTIPPHRDKLTANRTYYVNASTGSDSNDGLSTGTAFATINKAVNTAASLDIGQYTLQIQVADGTYGPVILRPCMFYGTPPALIGNVTTPANCVISATNDNAIVTFGATDWSVRGFKVQTTTAGSGISVIKRGFLRIDGNMEYGACAHHQIAAEDGGNVWISAAYRITGGAWTHYSATLDGLITMRNVAVTLSGTFSFANAFAGCIAGKMDANGATYTGGTVTGTRYAVSMNGAIINTGSATRFPGSSAGATNAGGQYS